MANTKEIKNRIKSVKDTQKITNAMYLIASTKMRKAKNELDETRPYFEALKNEIKRVFAESEHIESDYFFEPDEVEKGKIGYLIITADKGLAGAYNQNVIKEALNAIDDMNNARIFVVGEYGRRYFLSKHIPIDEDFNYMAPHPTLARAREMSFYLIDLFEKKEISRLVICYTDFKNGVSGGSAATMQALPFIKDDFKGGEGSGCFDFVPSPEKVLDGMIPSYLLGVVYSALVDSFCSEQNARMTAMDSANQNAEEILEGLSVEFNHVRQGAITQEITEVSSGARAKKKNANKGEGAN